MNKVIILIGLLVFLVGCSNNTEPTEPIIIDGVLTNSDNIPGITQYQVDDNQSELEMLGLTWNCTNDLFCLYYDENSISYLKYDCVDGEFLLILPTDSSGIYLPITLIFIDNEFYYQNEIGDVSPEIVEYNEGVLSSGIAYFVLSQEQKELFEYYSSILVQ